MKQSRALLALRSRADDNTRKTLIACSRGALVWSGDDAVHTHTHTDTHTHTHIKRERERERERERD